MIQAHKIWFYAPKVDSASDVSRLTKLKEGKGGGQSLILQREP